MKLLDINLGEDRYVHAELQQTSFQLNYTWKISAEYSGSISTKVNQECFQQWDRDHKKEILGF